MATLTQLASRYRWELMLFVGIPFIEWTTWWFLPHILSNFNIAFDVDSFPSYIAPFQNLSLALLGVLYFRVRRLGRAMLSLLWAFAFAYEVVVTAGHLVLNATDPEGWSAVSATWWSVGIFLVSIMILVWFARVASRTSFNHALVLIGLAIVLNGSYLLTSDLIFARFVDGPVAWDFVVTALVVTLFAVWVLARLDLAGGPHETDIERWALSLNVPIFGDLLRRFTVRMLPRFDPANGVNKELIITLFGMSWLLVVYITLRSQVGHNLETVDLILVPVLGIVLWTFSIALAIILAYVLRVRRQPESPSTLEPTSTA